MDEGSLVNYAPAARLAALVMLMAIAPLALVWLRSQTGDRRQRLAALTALTVFLTFDLVVFGSFTRLTDSGLGCPDWPGCYGHASPLGAHADISAAQAASPAGPVTFSKAWIEMIHRYLAMIVGMLCLVIAGASWLERSRLPHSPWLPTVTLLWVIVQGLFGRFTVTWKLYPMIVTLHLLGGMLLLSLLAVQHQAFRASEGISSMRVSGRWRVAVAAALGLVFLQIALGGWVSTNYAVLACIDVPRCNGQWWPDMDFANGFSVLRELGHAADGTGLPFSALVAIHMTHRLFAVVVVSALAILVWWSRSRFPGHCTGLVRALGVLTAAQVLTGLSNIVLGWPLLAALLHSAGAAGLVLILTWMLAFGWYAPAGKAVAA